MFSSIFSRDPAKDFKYELGEIIQSFNGTSFWTIHKAIKKGTSEEFSVFSCDAQKDGQAWLATAKGSIKRLKTMKHPNLLTYVDSLETEKLVYLVTEPVVPLADYLKTNARNNQQLLAWGLYQVAKAIQFLNETANIVHHNISTTSVFVNKAGEWKLGGLDYVTPADAEHLPSLAHIRNYLPPPEYSKGSTSRKQGEKWSIDIWGYGVLVYEVFNGRLPSLDALMTNINLLPEQLRPHYPLLVATDPRKRISPTEFINRCTTGRGFFHNSLIDAMNFLEEIQLKSPEEKNRFFSKLSELVESLPDEIGTYRILPQLLHSFEFGPGDNSTLPVLLKLGKGLKPDEYQKRIIPVVIKLFSSTDRGTRVQLLSQMRSYIDHLNSSIINNQVFPSVLQGFLDTAPAIREETVKSIVLLAPNLSSRNLNEEVMKHFARLQAKDEQASIRTNVTVCIGKIAPCLTPDVRLKVLVSAFSRALRDPFPPCRISGAAGFALTYEYYSMKEVAGRVLPSLCPGLMDPEKEVREQVFKAVKLFMERLEKLHENPELLTEYEAKVNAGSINIINSAANWAGWALNSVTAKFYKGKAGEEVTSKDAVVKPQANGSSRQESPVPQSLPVSSSSNSLQTPANGSVSKQSPAGWDDDDWSFLQEHSSKPVTASPVESAAKDGWDDADWSSPLEPAVPAASSSIPSLKPPPSGTVVKPRPKTSATAFDGLESEDIFAAPALKNTAKPSTAAKNASVAKNNRLQSPSAASSNQASWDSWETAGEPSATLEPVRAPKTAAGSAAGSKSMKLQAKKQPMDLLD